MLYHVNNVIVSRKCMSEVLINTVVQLEHSMSCGKDADGDHEYTSFYAMMKRIEQVNALNISCVGNTTRMRITPSVLLGTT